MVIDFDFVHFCLVNFYFISLPCLMTLASFVTFVYLSSDNVLTAETVFVSVSLFNIMRTPITLLPSCLMDVIKLFVSVKRVNRFLNAEELETKDDDSPAMDKQSSAVEVEDATFYWDDMADPTLTNINLQVRDHDKQSSMQ